MPQTIPSGEALGDGVEPDTGRATAGADPGAAGAAEVRGTGSTVGGAAGHRPRARGAVRGHRVDPRRVVADLRARDAGRGSAAGPVEPLPGPRRRGRGARRGLRARGGRPDAAGRDRRPADRWRRGGGDRDRRLRRGHRPSRAGTDPRPGHHRRRQRDGVGVRDPAGRGGHRLAGVAGRARDPGPRAAPPAGRAAEQARVRTRQSGRLGRATRRRRRGRAVGARRLGDHVAAGTLGRPARSGHARRGRRRGRSPPWDCGGACEARPTGSCPGG